MVRALAWSVVAVALVLTASIARQRAERASPAVKDGRAVQPGPLGRSVQHPGGGAAEALVEQPSSPPATARPPEAPKARPEQVGEPTSPVPSRAEPRDAIPRAPARKRSSGLRVESLVVGPTYRQYMCSEPTTRFSLRLHKRVNICIQIAPMREPVLEPVTVIWERNGTFYGTTEVTIAARHIRFRTRAHLAIDQSRVGDWSVRIVSSTGVELARTAFQVGP